MPEAFRAEVIERLTRIETKQDQFTKGHDDHEKRLRAQEHTSTRAIGFATGISATITILMNWIKSHA